MTDFSTLSDSELNRAVAEKLGWTVSKITTFGSSGGNWVGWYGLFGSEKDSTDSAKALKLVMDERDVWIGVPAYSTDANLALSLIGVQNFAILGCNIYHDMTIAQCKNSDGSGLLRSSAVGRPAPQAFARAICIAFLSAMEEGE